MNVPTIETLRRFTEAPCLVVSYENEDNGDESVGIAKEINVCYITDRAETVRIRFKWLLRTRAVIKGEFEKIQTRPVTGSLSVGNTMTFERLVILEMDELTCVLGSLEKKEEDEPNKKTKKKGGLEKEEEGVEQKVKEVITLTLHPFQLARAKDLREEYDSYTS